ncbi:lactonase family protein [Actinacidiphila acidipaludis]|uniref:lactonase family protein n=1 Tax=Actinacidiphila acidipaludis TaxID=2873382 RepID=UPI0027DFBE22|nr:lactonase family protein [Streptomyces acidipaludis]
MSDDEQNGPRTAPPGLSGLARRRLLGAAAAVALGGVAGSGRADAEPDRVGARAAGTAAPEAGTAAPAAPPARTPAPPATRAAIRALYVGTYTSSGGPGLEVAVYDPVSGSVHRSTALSTVADPSFLAARGSDVLYAVDENQDQVTAVAVAGGAPRVLNSGGTGGSGPCHLTVHAAGGHLLTANYGSGSVAVHRLAADGSLGRRTDLVRHTGSGPDPDRQSGPHTHMVLNDRTGGFVLAVDLGTDTVYTYRLATGTGKLTGVSTAQVTAGSGPRHAAFHPSGRHLYVANELGNSLTVCGYDPDSGRVTHGTSLPTVPGGGGSAPNYPAEVVVSADGAFVYVSNRGHDSVARYAVGAGGGRLRLLDAVASGGAYPRHIALDPSGAWLFAANQNSGTVAVFARDEATGALTPAGTPFAVTAPVCVLPQ